MDTHETVRAVVRTQRHGAPWVKWRPVIESAGADTIEFSFDVPVSDAMWDALERERETAQMLMKERRCVHAPDWLNAEMHPTGARGGYRFLLETPDFAIKLQKGLVNRPPIYVEMRAFGLHTHAGGELGAVEEACKFIRGTLLADQDQTWAAKAITADAARCSRLDRLSFPLKSRFITFSPLGSTNDVSQITMTYYGDVNYAPATVNFPLTNPPIPVGQGTGGGTPVVSGQPTATTSGTPTGTGTPEGTATTTGTATATVTTPTGGLGAATTPPSGDGGSPWPL